LKSSHPPCESKYGKKEKQLLDALIQEAKSLIEPTPHPFITT
jgi:hypothetical protein